MIDEETAKFIAGTRPLNEWDDFIASLKKIGVDRLYAEYTTQYKEIKVCRRYHPYRRHDLPGAAAATQLAAAAWWSPPCGNSTRRR